MRTVQKEELINRYIKIYDVQQYFGFDISKKIYLFSFRKGEHIIDQGYASDYLYMLVKGSVRMYTVSDKGKNIAIKTGKPFCLIGELSSLQERDPNNTVEAIDDVYMLALPFSNYRNKLLSDPIFLRHITKILFEQINLLYNNIVSYHSDSSEQRLASFIYYNSTDDYLNVSLQKISESIGVSYRHMIRLINKLCDDRIIQKTNRQYKILNKSALISRASKTYYSEQ